MGVRYIGIHLVECAKMKRTKQMNTIETIFVVGTTSAILWSLMEILKVMF